MFNMFIKEILWLNSWINYSLECIVLYFMKIPWNLRRACIWITFKFSNKILYASLINFSRRTFEKVQFNNFTIFAVLLTMQAVLQHIYTKYWIMVVIIITSRVIVFQSVCSAFRCFILMSGIILWHDLLKLSLLVLCEKSDLYILLDHS